MKRQIYPTVLRIDRDTRAMLTEGAAREGVSQAEFLRRAIQQRARRRPRTWRIKNPAAAI